MTVKGDADRLTKAIVAYVGYGSSRTPDSDEAAVRALDPVDGERTLALVKQIVAASDQLHIPREAFGTQDKSVLFGTEFEKIWPELSPEPLYALSWRWAYFEFF